METQTFDPRDYPLIIGIGFGTSFSSCAYAEYGAGEVIDISRWPRQSDVHPKVPTLSLYRNDSTKLLAWGHDAEIKARTTNDTGLLLSRFTLQPDKTLTASPLPNGLTVLDAITDYLAAFHSHVCMNIKRGLYSSYSQNSFRYCLVVPASWSEQTKAVIREAAIRANIINHWDHPDRFIFIGEPEAVASYCEAKSEQFNIGHGQRFLTCDAGRRTVDLAVFEIDNSGERRELKKVSQSSSDTCGSTFLDMRIREYLKDKFYRHREVNDTGLKTMLDAFADYIKPLFDGLEDQYLEAPACLDLEGIDDPDKGIEEETLMFSYQDLRQHVFEPAIKQILDLIDDQVQESKLEAVFVVGEFGMLEYLFKRLVDEFQSRVGGIAVPPRGELAAVRGVVYFELNLPIVPEPVLRPTQKPDEPNDSMNMVPNLALKPALKPTYKPNGSTGRKILGFKFGKKK